MDYLPKLKMGLGLPFGEHYLHASSIKMFLNQSVDKVSMLYLFFFSRYQTKYVIKFLFRLLMMS